MGVPISMISVGAERARVIHSTPPRPRGARNEPRGGGAPPARTVTSPHPPAREAAPDERAAGSVEPRARGPSPSRGRFPDHLLGSGPSGTLDGARRSPAIAGSSCRRAGRAESASRPSTPAAGSPPSARSRPAGTCARLRGSRATRRPPPRRPPSRAPPSRPSSGRATALRATLAVGPARRSADARATHAGDRRRCPLPRAARGRRRERAPVRTSPSRAASRSSSTYRTPTRWAPECRGARGSAAKPRRVASRPSVLAEPLASRVGMLPRARPRDARSSAVCLGRRAPRCREIVERSLVASTARQPRACPRPGPRATMRATRGARRVPPPPVATGAGFQFRHRLVRRGPHLVLRHDRERSSP